MVTTRILFPTVMVKIVFFSKNIPRNNTFYRFFSLASYFPFSFTFPWNGTFACVTTFNHDYDFFVLVIANLWTLSICCLWATNETGLTNKDRRPRMKEQKERYKHILHYFGIKSGKKCEVGGFQRLFSFTLSIILPVVFGINYW